MLEKMDLFFENRLKEYEEHMLSAIEGAREFYPFTAAQLPLEEGCEVLDLGCGTGLELDACAQSRSVCDGNRSFGSHARGSCG